MWQLFGEFYTIWKVLELLKYFTFKILIVTILKKNLDFISVRSVRSATFFYRENPKALTKKVCTKVQSGRFIMVPSDLLDLTEILSWCKTEGFWEADHFDQSTTQFGENINRGFHKSTTLVLAILLFKCSQTFAVSIFILIVLYQKMLN